MSKLAELQNTCVSLYQCQGRKSVFYRSIKAFEILSKKTDVPREVLHRVSLKQ